MDDDEEIPVLIEHEEKPQNEQSRKVPLTIICGFLGAGKSTLLKRILTEQHGFRIAVIMNEFGDTADIEAKTINVAAEGEESEEFLELANGCLCCSIKDTGIAAIEKLMQRKGAFDHILLETTGLADPGPIAALFWHNEEFATGLGRDISLDGVICVVDAVFGPQQMEEDHASDTVGESLRQIAGADILILNKTDLASPESLTTTAGLLRGVNPAAPIYRTVRAEIDVGRLLGVRAYAAPPAFPPSHEHDHKHGDHEHEHDHAPEPTHYELRGISSLLVAVPVLSRAKLDALDEWVRTVLWEQRLPGDVDAPASPLTVLRCKGLFVLDSGAQYVLQGVRNMYDIAEAGDALGVPDAGKLVLIGTGLDVRVRESLERVWTG
ncbi:CobW/HypB/UreG, nucleotide-binding domain-containing protein [Mycena albidolilacea]|uniref:CobW/HypB/UreG, nucleotide-binding domain-containing protein n=1 Tax=Mycena albidolilacea TaxID=1033008 RepID=A0AAD7F3B7_9AGAR|nr:CobW/HypB/UreG, nucleotide-binding domain-containing protein [Mycena albidolilacea]